MDMIHLCHFYVGISVGKRSALSFPKITCEYVLLPDKVTLGRRMSIYNITRCCIHIKITYVVSCVGGYLVKL